MLSSSDANKVASEATSVSRNKAWSLPIIDLSPLLTHGVVSKATDSKEVSVEDLKYSIFNLEHCYYNQLKLAELYCAIEDAPKMLVAFKPHRLTLHEVIVAVSTMIQYGNEASMRSAVIAVYSDSHFQSEVKLICESLEREREAIKKRVVFLLEKYKKRETIEDETENSLLKEIYEKAYSNRDKIGKRVDKFTADDAVVHVVTDRLYHYTASKKLKNYIKIYIDKLISAGKYKSIKIPRQNERYTFMVAGGQASGKGTTIEAIRSIWKSKVYVGMMW